MKSLPKSRADAPSSLEPKNLRGRRSQAESATRDLEAVVARIAADSRDVPATYLRETIVPDGGE